MALAKCSECGNAVSTEARACPKCGQPIKGAGAPVGAHSKIVILGVVLLGLLIAWFLV